MTSFAFEQAAAFHSFHDLYDRFAIEIFQVLISTTAWTCTITDTSIQVRSSRFLDSPNAL